MSLADFFADIYLYLIGDEDHEAHPFAAVALLAGAALLIAGCVYFLGP